MAIYVVLRFPVDREAWDFIDAIQGQQGVSPVHRVPQLDLTTVEATWKEGADRADSGPVGSGT